MTSHDGAPYPPDSDGLSPLRVLVHPHIDEANPYLTLLTEALEAHAVESRPFSWRRLVRGRFDILHVHWPELAVGPEATWKAAVASTLFAGAVAIARLRGIAVVWTVHNLGSHERWHPRIERILFWWWRRWVDGALTLSDWARDRARTRYPQLREIPFAVVAHGEYPAGPRPSRDDARRRLRIGANVRVVLHFGHLRPYKGTDHLIRCFTKSSLDMMLFVTGRARPDSYARQLEMLAGGDPRVRLDLEQAPAEQLDLLLAACDVVALPYRRVTHSGSVMLALGAHRPTVSTATGSMPELQRETSPGWLWLIEPLYQPEDLEEVLNRTLVEAPEGEPSLPLQDWTSIGRTTRALYAEVLSIRRS